MKIGAGKYYRTRGGRKAYVGFEMENVTRHSFAGQMQGSQMLARWDENGSWIDAYSESTNDLIEEWSEPLPNGADEWVYITKKKDGGVGTSFYSKGEKDLSGHSGEWLKVPAYRVTDD